MKKTTLTKIALLSMMLGFSAQAVAPQPKTIAAKEDSIETLTKNVEIAKKNVELVQNQEGVRAKLLQDAAGKKLVEATAALAKAGTPVIAPTAPTAPIGTDTQTPETQQAIAAPQNEKDKKIAALEEELKNLRAYIKAEHDKQDSVEVIGSTLPKNLTDFVTSSIDQLVAQLHPDFVKKIPNLKQALLNRALSNSSELVKLAGEAQNATGDSKRTIEEKMLAFDCLKNEDFTFIVRKLSELTDIQKSAGITEKSAIEVQAEVNILQNAYKSSFSEDTKEDLYASSFVKGKSEERNLTLRTPSITELLLRVKVANNANPTLIKSVRNHLNDILNEVNSIVDEGIELSVERDKILSQVSEAIDLNIRNIVRREKAVNPGFNTHDISQFKASIIEALKDDRKSYGLENKREAFEEGDQRESFFSRNDVASRSAQQYPSQRNSTNANALNAYRNDMMSYPYHSSTEIDEQQASGQPQQTPAQFWNSQAPFKQIPAQQTQLNPLGQQKELGIQQDIKVPELPEAQLLEIPAFSKQEISAVVGHKSQSEIEKIIAAQKAVSQRVRAGQLKDNNAND